MRVLIAEDDFVARRILKEILSPYGDCDVVVDGEEAVRAFQLAHEEQNPYHLVCLDIMMPNLDGQDALKRIRAVESERGIEKKTETKVIMITALSDPKTVFNAFYRGGATAYIVKPIDKTKLLNEIRQFGLIS
ncbi:MAG: response regulator [Desulfobacteraceae bacterium]|nr:MAG: response regulator [Desulfobacteraceae bacterium]